MFTVDDSRFVVNELKQDIGEDVSKDRWEALKLFGTCLAAGVICAGVFAIAGVGYGLAFATGILIGGGLEMVRDAGLAVYKSESLAAVRNKLDKIETSLSNIK